MARRVGRSIASAIPPAAQEFLASQPMAMIGSVDRNGFPWASLVTGEPGFMEALDERRISIAAQPPAGDPLRGNIRSNDQVGLIAIDPATRRRMRLNGRAGVGSDGTIVIQSQQVYANCPKYIQARAWELIDRSAPSARLVWNNTELNPAQQRRISEADTFFIASSHEKGGVDVSHRGGRPGFVQVLSERVLTWPDYVGNMMFQTLGNLALNPKAGLLFLDFDEGGTLQLSGRADIIWDEARRVGFPGAERVVEFHVEQVIEVERATNLRWRFLEYSPSNPTP
jgi:predicted pyridoxine 5'-phosphate oxidase superfamily flavin-nucleotide-binding protein